jgi:general secretion pathway protein D
VNNGQLTMADSVSGGTGAATQGTYAVLSFRALAPVSQTAIQVQPGALIGVGGIPVTAVPASPYDLAVIAR